MPVNHHRRGRTIHGAACADRPGSPCWRLVQDRLAPAANHRLTAKEPVSPREGGRPRDASVPPRDEAIHRLPEPAPRGRIRDAAPAAPSAGRRWASPPPPVCQPRSSTATVGHVRRVGRGICRNDCSACEVIMGRVATNVQSLFHSPVRFFCPGCRELFTTGSQVIHRSTENRQQITRKTTTYGSDVVGRESQNDYSHMA